MAEAISIKTDFPDIGKLTTRKLRKFRATMKDAHRDARESAEAEMHEVLRLLKVNASYKLSNSVTTKLINDSPNTDYFESVLFFKNINYVHYADQGRESGGFPPFEVIKKWASDKGLNLDDSIISKIRWSIGQLGTKTKHEFIKVAKPRIKKAVSKAIKKRLKEFNANNT